MMFHSVKNAPQLKDNTGSLTIIYIQLNRNAVPTSLFNFIKEELNFLNSEFIIKKNSGRNTFGTVRYFRFIEELGNYIVLPKGFIGRLIRFCRDNVIKYSLSDQRKLHAFAPYSFQATLRSYQLEGLETIRKKDIGVIVAAPASGKTVIALKIVAEKRQPTLIIVHRRQLALQWMERIGMPEYTEELIFDIENLNIRPEFEVLKPYFENFFKSRSVSVSITAVISKQNTIIALNAHSSDLEKLNQKVVEGVRFWFIQKVFLNKKPVQEEGNLSTEFSGDAVGIYGSGEELLLDILAKGNYRHQMQLQYLAGLHESGILKIRFILSPFAFVFLLAGNENYHLVMETLDTEEATYIWHLPKNIHILRNEMANIEKCLDKIHHDGRQAFLNTNPIDFSRLLHDYSDERKGVVLWKDALNERLT